MRDTIFAAVVARLGRRGIWALTVPLCPYCGRMHQHGGGGDGPSPFLGSRAAHCDKSQGRSYELVMLPHV